VPTEWYVQRLCRKRAEFTQGGKKVTKKRHLALLCAVVIIGLLIPPVIAVEAAPGEDLYSPLNGAQERPDIDGNMIVWEDNRNGNKDIYFGTVDKFRADSGRGTQHASYTGEQITDNPASQEKPSISGDYIVWQDNRNGNWDIYFYKRSTGVEELLTGTGNQWMPIVRGKYAAWYDDSNGKTNVVLYDIAAGSVKKVIDCDATTTIPWGTTEFKPALSEKYVAWVEEDDWRVHYYDIAAGTVVGPVSTSTAAQTWPSLYGSLITWEDYRSGDADIYMTDLASPSGGEQRITFDTSYQASPSISGSIIAWEDMRKGPYGGGERGIFLYDLKSGTGEEKAVRLPDKDYIVHLYPAVSGNTIVWQNGRGESSNLHIFAYNPSASVKPTLKRIEITPPGGTLKVGETKEFTATTLDQDGNEISDVKISWSSSNMTVGTIGESSGIFTAHAAGTTTITAASGEINGTTTVTVNAPAPVKRVLTSIAIDPTEATVAVDETRAFEATALDQFDEEMTGITITWTSSNTTVGDIDKTSHKTSLFTAHAAGTTTITAASGEINGTATVTVSAENPVLDRITIKLTPTTLEINETETFTAIALDQFDNEMTGITFAWTSSNETVGTIDKTTGLFTAHAVGTTTITASADSKSAEALITVTAAAQVDPVPESIVIKPTEATLAVGETKEFAATALDLDGNKISGVEIAWTSSDETIGTIGDSSGLFTALAAGTTTITATAGDRSAEATVTVTAEDPIEPVIASLRLTPPRATLEVGDDQRFMVTAFDQDNNIISAGEVTWESSDDAVGTINASGIFTALAEGTVTITAETGDVSAQATITVNAPAPAFGMIVVSPSAVTLETGDTLQFDVIAFDPFGNIVEDAEITWMCCDENVGMIDDCGVFTAVCGGTTTVTATGDGATGTATVTVTDAAPAHVRTVVTPAAITPADSGTGAITTMVNIVAAEDCSGVVISPSAIILDPEDKWQFSATVYGLQDNAANSKPKWSCSAGTITQEGLFTAEREGTATIIASVEGVNETGIAEVTVRSASPSQARIVVSPSDFTIAAGQSLKLTATAFDQNGDPMPDVEVTWESSDPCIGTIDQETGLFTALADGEVRLTASAGEANGSACVTVEPSIAVPTCIEVEPSPATIEVGNAREFVATVFDQCDNEMDWVRVAWSCSDPDVGTLDRAGLFAAFAEGSADVTAWAGGKEGTAAVTVTTGFTIDPTPTPTPIPTNPGNSGGATYHDWGDGGGDTGPTFSAGMCENLMSGETFTFSDISVSSVSSVAITAADAIPRMMVTVKEVGRPTAAKSPADDIYEYVDISLYWADQRGISNASVIFTISADWLEDHGMAPEDVRLMRYVDGAWQSLETEVIGEGSGKYRFRAITPGFSTFAIAAAAPENETTVWETNVTTGEETNVTTNVTGTGNVTGEATTEATTVPATTTPATPLVYAPLLAPLSFLLWRRKNR
jgi:PGF-pre-PGF domain-containing protein